MRRLWRSLAGRMFVYFLGAALLHGCLLYVLSQARDEGAHRLEQARLEAGREVLTLYPHPSPQKVAEICRRYHLVVRGRDLAPEPVEGIFLLVDDRVLIIVVLFWLTLTGLAGALTIRYASALLDGLREVTSHFASSPGKVQFGEMPEELAATVEAFERLAERLAERQEQLRTCQASLAKDTAFRANLMLRLSIELAPEVASLRSMVARIPDGPASETLRSQAAALARRISDLRDASELESDRFNLQVQVIDAKTCVQAALERLRALAEERKVRCRLSGPEGTRFIQGDPVRFEQLVNILVSNAIESSPPGTRVDVTVEPLGSETRLTVSDQGRGLSSEQLASLSRPFVPSPTSLTGEGLALALARRLAELHRGRVDVLSQAGPGTTIAITFGV